MRELARRWLADAGHEVVVVSMNQLGAERRLDLVMMDVANPRGVAERVQLLRASHCAPVLLVSGGLRRRNDPSPNLAQQLGAAAVLAKPYTREQLLAAIATGLAAAP